MRFISDELEVATYVSLPVTMLTTVMVFTTKLHVRGIEEREGIGRVGLWGGRGEREGGVWEGR